jgi:hypothetical protein
MLYSAALYGKACSAAQSADVRCNFSVVHWCALLVHCVQFERLVTKWHAFNRPYLLIAISVIMQAAIVDELGRRFLIVKYPDGQLQRCSRHFMFAVW